MDGYQEKKESNTVYSQRKTYQKRNSSHRSQKIHSGDIIPQQSKDNHYKEGVYTRISTGRRSTGRQSGTPGRSGRRRSQSAYGENRRRRSGAENNLREWEILEQENERDYQEYLAQKRKRREPQPAQNAAGTRPVIDADERKGYFPCAFAGRSGIFLLFSRAVSRKHVPPAACRHPLYFCFCLEVSWLNPIPVPPLAGTPLIQCGCSISSARP